MDHKNALKQAMLALLAETLPKDSLSPIPQQIAALKAKVEKIDPEKAVQLDQKVRNFSEQVQTFTRHALSSPGPIEKTMNTLEGHQQTLEKMKLEQQGLLSIRSCLEVELKNAFHCILAQPKQTIQPYLQTPGQICALIEMAGTTNQETTTPLIAPLLSVTTQMQKEHFLALPNEIWAELLQSDFNDNTQAFFDQWMKTASLEDQLFLLKKVLFGRANLVNSKTFWTFLTRIWETCNTSAKVESFLGLLFSQDPRSPNLSRAIGEEVSLLGLQEILNSPFKASFLHKDSINTLRWKVNIDHVDRWPSFFNTLSPPLRENRLLPLIQFSVLFRLVEHRLPFLFAKHYNTKDPRVISILICQIRHMYQREKTCKENAHVCIVHLIETLYQHHVKQSAPSVEEVVQTDPEKGSQPQSSSAEEKSVSSVVEEQAHDSIKKLATLIKASEFQNLLHLKKPPVLKEGELPEAEGTKQLKSILYPNRIDLLPDVLLEKVVSFLEPKEYVAFGTTCQSAKQSMNKFFLSPSYFKRLSLLTRSEVEALQPPLANLPLLNSDQKNELMKVAKKINQFPVKVTEIKQLVELQKTIRDTIYSNLVQPDSAQELDTYIALCKFAPPAYREDHGMVFTNIWKHIEKFDKNQRVGAVKKVLLDFPQILSIALMGFETRESQLMPLIRQAFFQLSSYEKSKVVSSKLHGTPPFLWAIAHCDDTFLKDQNPRQEGENYPLRAPFLSFCMSKEGLESFEEHKTIGSWLLILGKRYLIEHLQKKRGEIYKQLFTCKDKKYPTILHKAFSLPALKYHQNPFPGKQELNLCGQTISPFKDSRRQRPTLIIQSNAHKCSLAQLLHCSAIKQSWHIQDENGQTPLHYLAHISPMHTPFIFLDGSMGTESFFRLFLDCVRSEEVEDNPVLKGASIRALTQYDNQGDSPIRLFLELHGYESHNILEQILEPSARERVTHQPDRATKELKTIVYDLIMDEDIEILDLISKAHRGKGIKFLKKLKYGEDDQNIWQVAAGSGKEKVTDWIQQHSNGNIRGLENMSNKRRKGKST